MAIRSLLLFAALLLTFTLKTQDTLTSPAAERYDHVRTHTIDMRSSMLDVLIQDSPIEGEPDQRDVGLRSLSFDKRYFVNDYFGLTLGADLRITDKSDYETLALRPGLFISVPIGKKCFLLSAELDNRWVRDNDGSSLGTNLGLFAASSFFPPREEMAYTVGIAYPHYLADHQWAVITEFNYSNIDPLFNPASNLRGSAMDFSIRQEMVWHGRTDRSTLSQGELRAGTTVVGGQSSITLRNAVYEAPFVIGSGQESDPKFLINQLRVVLDGGRYVTDRLGIFGSIAAAYSQLDEPERPHFFGVILPSSENKEVISRMNIGLRYHPLTTARGLYVDGRIGGGHYEYSGRIDDAYIQEFELRQTRVEYLAGVGHTLFILPKVALDTRLAYGQWGRDRAPSSNAMRGMRFNVGLVTFFGR